jgi:predicted naringenin-chalcone synthase
VVCAELCSLHVRTSNDPDTIMGSALFADGAAAAVVTAKPGAEESALLQLDHFETVLTPVGEDSMAWNIGDHGFEMVLGNYVPHIIDDHIVGALQPLLAREPALEALPYTSIRHWAIHPDGRSILDKVQSRLGLSDRQLVPAREVLRNYGNMSSATVLFVLKHILDQDNGISDTQAGANQAAGSGPGDHRICSMAFGPGLTVETALFTRLPQVPRVSTTAVQQDSRYEPAEAPVS